MAKAEDSPEFIAALEALETTVGDWKARCAEVTSQIESLADELRGEIEPDELALRALLEPPKIKSFGSVTLYPNRIVMNGVLRQLNPGMKTLAETRGNINRAKRSLLTRSAVGVATLPIAFGLGFFATPKTKKHDDREVVLIVEGADWAEMATYSPALQRDVVRFAKEIEATADEWAAGQVERMPKAAAIAHRIRQVQEGNPALNSAVALLETTRSETAAQDALDAVQSLIADEDLKVSRELRKRIEAAQRTVGELALAAAPPPPPGGKGGGRWRTVTMADLKTESMGLAFRRSANDLARSLGRWQSNPADGPAGGRGMPLDDLLAIAESETTSPPQEPPPPVDPAPSAPSSSDTVEALGRLAEMHQAGVLTDDEFAAAKARLLGT